LALKAKHEQEKDRFESEIKKLQEKLNEKDEVIEFDDKSIMRSEMDMKKGAAGQKAEFSNPTTILKKRLNKLIAVIPSINSNRRIKKRKS
jgi:hypothetical protein